MHGAVLKVFDGTVIVVSALATLVIVNEALRESRNTPAEAMQRCWDSILPELVLPAGAELNEELSRTSARARRRDDPTRWRVYLAVDHPDGGATTRQYHLCEIVHDPEADSWTRMKASGPSS